MGGLRIRLGAPAPVPISIALARAQLALAGRDVGLALSGNFSTSFPATENPISQGGIWVNGGSVGLKWQNVETTPGKAFGANFAGQTFQGTEFDDPCAHLSTAFRTFANNQFSQGTVFRAGGYTPSVSHEIEIWVRAAITANNARGYEVLWAGTDGTIAIVRWNGPLADSSNSNNGFTQIATAAGGVPAHGDVLRAEIIAGVIKVYKNGSLVLTGPSDTTWTSGQPGMGFWPRSGGNVVRANLGWQSYSAGDL